MQTENLEKPKVETGPQPEAIEKSTTFEVPKPAVPTEKPKPLETPPVRVLPMPATKFVITKSQALVAIEKIMSEDLKDLYLKLPPEMKAKFKSQGEAVAQKVESLIKVTKVKIKEILELIKNWLKLIPGVNIFFLEQEAKIKTDQILQLRDDLKNRGEL